MGAIPNVNIVDWVLLDIRDAASAATATGATSVAKIPGFHSEQWEHCGLWTVVPIRKSPMLSSTIFLW